MFGPYRESMFKQLAQDLNGQFEKRNYFSRPAVRLKSGAWEILVDAYDNHSNNSHQSITRIRAPYLTRDGLQFKVFRESLFSRIGKAMGMQDIITGHIDFDRSFVVQGNQKDSVFRLFKDEALRQVLSKTTHTVLEAKEKEGLFGKRYPKGVYVLQAKRTGHLRDLEELKAMIALFPLALQQMVDIRAAYERDPQFRL